MNADAPARRIWHTEEPLPMPVMGWIGFGVSVLTLVCMLIAWGGSIHNDGWSWSSIAFQLWCLLYGGGLIWSWWVMRPLRVTRATHYLVAGGLLGQALSYLGMWSGAAVSAWTDRSAGMLPFPEHLDLMGLALMMSLISLVFVGPIFGLMAIFSARGGGWMAATQIVGVLGFVVTVLSTG